MEKKGESEECKAVEKEEEGVLVEKCVVLHECKDEMLEAGTGGVSGDGGNIVFDEAGCVKFEAEGLGVSVAV